MNNRSLVPLLLAAALGAGAATAAGVAPTPDPERGKQLYMERCAACHGANGDGDGPAARQMVPAPRDFTSGLIKFKSTPMGVPALDTDVYDAIARGLPGRSMPSWSELPTEDIWQLTYTVRSFSSRFDGEAGAAIVIPAPPQNSPELRARGAEVNAAMGCSACHGADGRGDGPAAAALVDAAGDPVAPADLGQPELFGGGAGPEQVFRTISTGIEGTPMPGYAAMTSDDDRWALVLWVASLER